MQRGGAWYVSLFYSIADNATHQAGLPNPTAADRIAAVGSPSPEAAVDAFVKKATAGEVEGAIALTAPDEMGVLHDYGKLLVDKIYSSDVTSGLSDLGFTVTDAGWTVSDVTGGKKVSLASLTVSAQGQTATITRDAAAGIADRRSGWSDADPRPVHHRGLHHPGRPAARTWTRTMVDIIKREFQQIIGLGIVTVQVDGQWYVSPVRSLSDIGVSPAQGPAALRRRLPDRPRRKLSTRTATAATSATTPGTALVPGRCAAPSRPVRLADLNRTSVLFERTARRHPGGTCPHRHGKNDCRSPCAAAPRIVTPAASNEPLEQGECRACRQQGQLRREGHAHRGWAELRDLPDRRRQGTGERRAAARSR